MPGDEVMGNTWGSSFLPAWDGRLPGSQRPDAVQSGLVRGCCAARSVADVRPGVEQETSARFKFARYHPWGRFGYVAASHDFRPPLVRRCPRSNGAVANHATTPI